MDTRLSPRQGPENPSIADQIAGIIYFSGQSAAITLANSIAIDLRGKRSLRVLVIESSTGAMSGRLAFYFSAMNTAGSDAGYETVPSQEHIVTSSGVGRDVSEYYRFDLPREGGSYLRIPITEAILNGTVAVLYMFGD